MTICGIRSTFSGFSVPNGGNGTEEFVGEKTDKELGQIQLDKTIVLGVVTPACYSCH